MIQIGNTIISLDVIEKKFCCDLSVCRGICCVEGDSGAPLEKGEEERIRENYAGIKPYMKSEGIQAVDEQGLSVIDMEGDVVTPLIRNGECAYAIEANGSCWCAIEKAWVEGKSTFRKPVSCHLYPVRITKYPSFDAVNYHEWKVCIGAKIKGEREGIPLYLFLKDALIAKYGEEWYDQVCYVANEIKRGKVKFKL